MRHVDEYARDLLRRGTPVRAVPEGREAQRGDELILEQIEMEVP
jgi:hypothetical protein